MKGIIERLKMILYDLIEGFTERKARMPGPLTPTTRGKDTMPGAAELNQEQSANNRKWLKDSKLKMDITQVIFSNNTVALGNSDNSSFIDFILDICNDNHCKIVSIKLIEKPALLSCGQQNTANA